MAAYGKETGAGGSPHDGKQVARCYGSKSPFLVVGTPLLMGILAVVGAACFLALGVEVDGLRLAFWLVALLISSLSGAGFLSALAAGGTLTLTGDSRIEFGGRSFMVADLSDIEYGAAGYPDHTVLRYRDGRGKLNTLHWNASAADRSDFIARIRRRNPATVVRRHEQGPVSWALGTVEWPRNRKRGEAVHGGGLRR